MRSPKRLEVKLVNDAKVIFLPDIHAPYHSPALLKRAIEIVQVTKPDYIVQLGDWADAYAFSSWDSSREMLTPAKEIAETRRVMATFWADVQAAAPNAKCYSLAGNHNQRISKMVIRLAPALEAFMDKPITEFHQFKNVISLEHEKDELVLVSPEWGKIVCIHGFLSKAGDHTRYFLENTVRGHSHRASVSYIRKKDRTLFEIEAGCLIDINSRAFEYRQALTSQWVPALAVLDSNGPRVIPL